MFKSPTFSFSYNFCIFLVNFQLSQALVARLVDVNANTGIVSGVLVTVGDLARVVRTFLFFSLLFFNLLNNPTYSGLWL